MERSRCRRQRYSLRTYAPDRGIGSSIWYARENSQDERKTQVAELEPGDVGRQKSSRPDDTPVLSADMIEQPENSQNLDSRISFLDDTIAEHPLNALFS